MITGLTLSQSSITLGKNSSVKLSCSITPSDTSDYEIMWIANNSNIELEPNGLSCNVKGVSEGASIVTALELFSSKIASCNVTVTASATTPPVTTIQNLYVGEAKIIDLFYGNSQISKMYLGDILILQNDN